MINWWQEGLRPGMIAHRDRAVNYLRWIDSERHWDQQRVIEVGTGSGWLSQWLLQRGVREVLSYEHNPDIHRITTRIFDQMGESSRWRSVNETFRWQPDLHDQYDVLIQECFGQDVYQEGIGQWLPQWWRWRLDPPIRMIPNHWRIELWSAPVRSGCWSRMWQTLAQWGRNARLRQGRSRTWSSQAEWQSTPPQHRRWPHRDIPMNPLWLREIEQAWQVTRPAILPWMDSVQDLVTWSEADQWQEMANYTIDFERGRMAATGSEWLQWRHHPEWRWQSPPLEGARMWCVIQNPGQTPRNKNRVDWWNSRDISDASWVDQAMKGRELTTWGQGHPMWVTQGPVDSIQVTHRQPTHPQQYPLWSVTAHRGGDSVTHDWFWSDGIYQR